MQAISTLTIALLYRKELSQWQMLLPLVLLGFNPYLTQEKNEILSDLPFVLFLYAALVQARYLLTILPVYLYYLVCGLEALHTFVAARSQIAARLTLTMLAALLLMSYAGKYARSGLAASFQVWDSSLQRELYPSIQSSTPLNAIILASSPRALALYTDRQAAMFPELTDAESLRRYIVKTGATHALLPSGRASQWRSWGLVEHAAEPVLSIADYALYKTARVRGASSGDPAVKR